MQLNFSGCHFGYVACLSKETLQISVLEFSRDRKMMSILCSRNQSHILFSKGAPESIISRCSSILCNEDGSTSVLTSSIRAEVEARFQRLELVAFYQCNKSMLMHVLLHFLPSLWLYLFIFTYQLCRKFLSSYVLLFSFAGNLPTLYFHCVQREAKENNTFQTWLNLHFSCYWAH